jgi:hypothetical protein
MLEYDSCGNGIIRYLDSAISREPEQLGLSATLSRSLGSLSMNVMIYEDYERGGADARWRRNRGRCCSLGRSMGATTEINYRDVEAVMANRDSLI